MTRTFKYQNRYYVFDDRSGALLPISELEDELLSELSPPLEPCCPSSLRYELAMYSSTLVDRAYARLRELYLSGAILQRGDGEARVRISGEHSSCEAPLIAAALRAAGGDAFSPLGEVTPELKSELSSLGIRML